MKRTTARAKKNQAEESGAEDPQPVKRGKKAK
jgi:hypothetical protein